MRKIIILGICLLSTISKGQGRAVEEDKYYIQTIAIKTSNQIMYQYALILNAIYFPDSSGYANFLGDLSQRMTYEHNYLTNMLIPQHDSAFHKSVLEFSQKQLDGIRSVQGKYDQIFGSKGYGNTAKLSVLKENWAMHKRLNSDWDQLNDMIQTFEQKAGLQSGQRKSLQNARTYSALYGYIANVVEPLSLGLASFQKLNSAKDLDEIKALLDETNAHVLEHKAVLESVGGFAKDSIFYNNEMNFNQKFSSVVEVMINKAKQAKNKGDFTKVNWKEEPAMQEFMLLFGTQGVTGQQFMTVHLPNFILLKGETEKRIKDFSRKREVTPEVTALAISHYEFLGSSLNQVNDELLNFLDAYPKQDTAILNKAYKSFKKALDTWYPQIMAAKGFDGDVALLNEAQGLFELLKRIDTECLQIMMPSPYAEKVNGTITLFNDLVTGQYQNKLATFADAQSLFAMQYDFEG